MQCNYVWGLPSSLWPKLVPLPRFPWAVRELIGLVSFPRSSALRSGVERGELALRLIFRGREGYLTDSG